MKERLANRRWRIWFETAVREAKMAAAVGEFSQLATPEIVLTDTDDPHVCSGRKCPTLYAEISDTNGWMN